MREKGDYIKLKDDAQTINGKDVSNKTGQIIENNEPDWLKIKINGRLYVINKDVIKRTVPYLEVKIKDIDDEDEE